MKRLTHGARRVLLAFLVLSVAAVAGFGQAMDFTAPGRDAAEGGAVAPVDERLQLAVSDPEYPVTPGDIYSMTFLQGVELVSSQLLVESDYTINMGVLGKVNARGNTFAELKPQIEQIIARAYPRSLPSVTISSIGLFRVTLSGAIPRAQRITAWGLSRLSDLVTGVTGPYTSLRRVTVVSADGSESTYDVFRAIDQGAVDQDPRLRPGDSVVFVRRGTVVGVRGQVYEPGSYEILPGEGLAELRQFFQDFTPNADLTRLVVQRQAGEQVRQISLGAMPQAEQFPFANGDVLTVPSRVVPRPVVFVEGAVEIAFDVQIEADEQSLIPVYNRITRELTVGDTLYSLLLDIQDRISPFADIDRGYIIRDQVQDPIRINMREVLYRQSEYNDFELQPFDRVVIPLDQPYVVISGDVENPARYPYNPAADYAYYLNLAGTGAESFLEVRDRVRVYDRDGGTRDVDSTIQPGFSIHVLDRAENVVVVSGAVPNPGAHPYEPSRGFVSYLRLAGVGAESLGVVRESVQIYDESGAPRPRDGEIQPGDTIFVPTRDDQFVVVSGDVPTPGAYVYESSRDFAYYLRLAGIGANALAVVRNTVEVYDEAGNTVGRGAPILPEYTVFVPPTEEQLTPEGAFVLVTGAVASPGLYEIFGERTASYYIQRAGGVDTEVSADGSYTVRTASGEQRGRDAVIASGDTIEVARNGFIYNFNRYFPVITAGLTFITTIITIVTALNR